MLSFFKDYYYLPILLLFLSISGPSFAQDDWIDYITVKDKGVMSVSLDLSLDLSRPRYNNLLLVGGQFIKCMDNGFPTEEGLQDLLTFSDSTAMAIDEIT